jgi:hypothetical protein
MSWSDPVDLYCERTSAAFWAEPVNALTNAAFLLAAFAAFVQWRRAGGRDLPVLALILVLIAIAFGSFAFHTLATRGAAYLDVIPIAVFIYGFLALALRRFLALPWLATLLALAVFFAVTRILQWLFPPATLNGSLDYVPALAAMLLLVWFVPAGIRPATWLAAAVFTVSLVFRTVDQAICGAFPLGTHFVWHVLNAAVLFVLLNAAIMHGPRTAAAAGTKTER